MSRRGNLQNVVSIIFKFAFCKLPGSVFRVLSGCFTLMINEWFYEISNLNENSVHASHKQCIHDSRVSQQQWDLQKSTTTRATVIVVTHLCILTFLFWSPFRVSHIYLSVPGLSYCESPPVFPVCMSHFYSYDSNLFCNWLCALLRICQLISTAYWCFLICLLYDLWLPLTHV